MNQKRETDIRIDTVGRRGDGVGTLGGRPVFVPRALPGELVHVKLDSDRGEGLSGRLLALIESSPDRVTPPCPHYDECGGCSLQHWSDEAYARWTRERVRDMMDRNNITVGHWPEPVFVPAHTRRRATFAAVMRSGKLSFGFHKTRTHFVTDIPSCMVLSPRLQAVMDAVRPHLRALLSDGQDADIFVQDTGISLDMLITGQIGARKDPQLKQREAMAAMVHDAQLARLCWRLRERDEPELIAQAAPVTKMAGNLPVILPPGAFMQPSKAGEEALVAAALAPMHAARAKNTADLFAGCGTFTGPMLDLGSVTAIESDGPAADALGQAAQHTAHLRVEKRNLFTTPLKAGELEKFDAVLFDPPRAGAFAQAQEMAHCDVPLLVGVSCNPATFARDARVLCDGGYKLDALHIVDQFTWSAHVELVGIFKR